MFSRPASQAAPGFGEAWFWLGRVSYEGGDYQGAVQAYGKALELNPGYAATKWYREAQRALD